MSGSFVLSSLAKNSFSKFAKNFYFDVKISVVPIDDHTDRGYSHTAILAKNLKSDILKPQWGALRAKNRVSYANTTLEFRKQNPRNFTFKRTKQKDIILVDDVITTGSTILEATKTIKQAGYEPLFALTLADAKEGDS